MIISFFLEAIYVFITFFFGLMPALAIPDQFLSAVVQMIGYVNALNFLFPVSTLLQVLAIALTFHIGIMLWHFVLWIIHLIRGR